MKVVKAVKPRVIVKLKKIKKCYGNDKVALSLSKKKRKKSNLLGMLSKYCTRERD